MTTATKSKDSGHVGSVTVHVTERCNLACTYCFSRQKRDGRRMDKKTALAFCQWFAGQARQGEYDVTFFGGEPFLETDLMHSIATDLGRLAPPGVRFAFGATSNGTIIRPAHEALLRAHSIGVLLSADGGQETHDRCRVYPGGQGSFGDFLQGLKTLRAVQSRPSARLTFTPDTVKVLAANHRILFLDHGFGTVSAAPVTEASWNESSLDEFEQQLCELADFIIEQWQAGRLLHAGILEKGVRALLETPPAWEYRYPCGAGRAMAGVGADGRIYPCHRFVGMDEFVIGDVVNGIDPALRSQFWEMPVEDGLDCHPGGCGKCDLSFMCRGDCYQVNFATNGNIKAPCAAHYGISSRRIRVSGAFLKCLLEGNSRLLDAILGHKPGTAEAALEGRSVAQDSRADSC